MKDAIDLHHVTFRIQLFLECGPLRTKREDISASNALSLILCASTSRN